MSKISRKAKELKSLGCHETFLRRIEKTLYYGKLPGTDRLSLPVTELASELFSEAKTSRSIDRLHCKDAAYISREACISPCSFVLAMVYLERLKICNPEYLQCIAPSQLFLVSLMVSSKFLYDNGEDSDVLMTEWAASGGLSLEELIVLEKEFLNAIDWNIFVNESSFWAKLSNLESIIAKQQGKERGFFTYTELSATLMSIEIHALLNFVATVSAVIFTAYLAGILTILGSMFIASNMPGSALRTTVNTKPAHINEAVSTLNGSLLKESMLLHIDTSSLLQNSIAEEDEESGNWDWWNNSAMAWLAQTTELVENVSLIGDWKSDKTDTFKSEECAFEDCEKDKLQGHLSGGAKCKLKDKLEYSWHKEWVESLEDIFLENSNFIRSRITSHKLRLNI